MKPEPIRWWHRRLCEVLWQDWLLRLLREPGEELVGWCDGGCLVLAEALLAVLPQSEGLMLVRRGPSAVTEHALVSWRGYWWDGDGAARPRTVLRRWQRLYPYRFKVQPLDRQMMSSQGVPTSDLARKARLVEVLRRDVFDDLAVQL